MGGKNSKLKPQMLADLKEHTEFTGNYSKKFHNFHFIFKLNFIKF